MMKLPFSVAILVSFLSLCNASKNCKDIRVPEGKCATIFDGKDCTGWSVDVSTGNIDLSVRERNEAESVVVKPGCNFTSKKNCLISFMVRIVNQIAS